MLAIYKDCNKMHDQKHKINRMEKNDKLFVARLIQEFRHFKDL